MNKNQIAKGIRRAEKTYINSERYSQLVDESRLVYVDLTDLQNTVAMATDYSKVVKDAVISLPFGNVLFHVKGYPMMSLKDGEVRAEDMAVHIMPCVVSMKEHNLVTMVVTDLRLYQKETISRSYIAYADQSGIHVMTAVDKACAAHGCNCYRQNVFSRDPGLALQFLERMPGFAPDAGFALPDCTGLKPGCASVNASRTEMTQLIKVILAYANLPTNFFVKVIHNDKKNRLCYYIICDQAQWDALKAGDINGETKGNLFKDGSNLPVAIKAPLAITPSETITIGDRTYTPIGRDDDEAGTGAEGSEKADERGGTPVAADLPKDAP